MNFDFGEKISDASGLGGVGIGTPHLGGSLEGTGGATALVPPHIMQMVRLSQRMVQENSHQQHYHQHHPVNLTSFNSHKTAAEAFLHNQYAIASFAQAPVMSTQIATTAANNGGDYQFMMTSSPSTSSTTSSSGGSSSSPPLPPRSYKPCFVCGDKSSGYHYGVSSCEGCKGFFRRSIQKNAKYVCHREKSCEITKTTRSRCQHCRLHKCLDVGMIRESVRNPHHRKRGKEKKTASAGAGIAGPNGTAGVSWKDQRRAYLNAFEGNHQQLREIFPQMLPRDMESLVSIITAAHIKTCPSLNQIKRFTVSGSDLHMAMAMKQKVDLNMWTLFSERSTKCIEKIVEFAKLIPGFLDFSIHDQITLVKYASMDVLVLRLCSRYDVGDDSMTFSDGLTLNRTQMHNCGFGPITKVVFDFAKRLIPLDMDETEIALLSALCIACSDHVDLEEPERVQDVQDPIIEALRLYSRKRRPNLPLIFPQLVMKLYDLRTISLRGEERCQSLDKEIPDGSMPPLISELLLSKDE